MVVQNAEELLAREDWRAMVDGVACEDLFYNGNEPNSTEETETRLSLLLLGPVALVVDYPTEPGKVEDFYRRARASGLIPYRTLRGLDTLVVNPEDP